MNKQEQINDIVKRLKDCRNELEQIKDELISSKYQKVKASLNSSISFLNRAKNQILEATPLEGQMSIFDFDFSDEERDLEP